MLGLPLDVLIEKSSRAIAFIAMGRKKHNLCSGCGMRHAAPTGKSCTAGAGVLIDKDSGDELITRGQVPNRGGLDDLVIDVLYIYMT